MTDLLLNAVPFPSYLTPLTFRNSCLLGSPPLSMLLPFSPGTKVLCTCSPILASLAVQGLSPGGTIEGLEQRPGFQTQPFLSPSVCVLLGCGGEELGKEGQGPGSSSSS